MNNPRRILLICVFLFVFILNSCQQNSFDYVDAISSNNSQYGKTPWENTVKFSYETSKDGVNNVINFQYTHRSKIYVTQNKLYFKRHFMPVLYDVTTGKQSYLCTDPLCAHKTNECPFANAVLDDGFWVVDDKVLFYSRNDNNRQVMLYSITDRTMKCLRTVEGNWSSPHIIALKDRYFFIDILYDEESGSFNYSLCRQMYDSGDIKVIRSENSYNTALLAADEDIVYIHDEAEGAIIALTSDGDNELSRTLIENVQMAICKEGYLIFTDETGELFRMNLDGSNRHSLGISGVEYFYLTDSYIYYRVIEERKYGLAIVPGYEDEETFVDLQAIYRINHEGNDQELIWNNLKETDVLILDDFVVDGNYIYAMFTHCRIDGNNMYFTENIQNGEKYITTYCRIDCKSRNIYYIDVE